MASDATPERLRETVGEGSPAWISRDFKASSRKSRWRARAKTTPARAARSARINLGVGGGARRDFDFTTSAPPAKYEPEHAEEGHAPEEIDEETRKTRKNDEDATRGERDERDASVDARAVGRTRAHGNSRRGYRRERRRRGEGGGGRARDGTRVSRRAGPRRRVRRARGVFRE